MTRTQAFKNFLNCFSKEKLPITLSDDNIGYFDRKNPPLNVDVIRQFIKPGEGQDDDLTEYVACCQIPGTETFHAIIYWRGMILEYDYILATYNKNGVLINKKIIAGVRSNGQNVLRSVATIDEDWIISIVAGELFNNEELYDPLKSKMMTMELLANGEIIFSLQE